MNLAELEWRPAPNKDWSMATAGGYEVACLRKDGAGGEYGQVAGQYSIWRVGTEECLYKCLDAIAAQAILYHLLENKSAQETLG